MIINCMNCIHGRTNREEQKNAPDTLICTRYPPFPAIDYNKQAVVFIRPVVQCSDRCGEWEYNS
jgi:hypothetical protein